MTQATDPTRVEARPVPFLDLGRIHEPLRTEFDRAWQQVVDASAFVGGDHVAAFEDAFARHAGAQQAIGVANGTDALHLTLRALDIGAGDEVILPANTFVATAEAVRLAGAEPRVVDVDDGTLLMTADAVADAITDRTAAVIVVHLFGQMADMGPIAEVARRRGIALIEDAAQAHGARLDGQRAGSFGVAGCFSFYPGKNLGALGDGGAVITDDDRLADRLRSLSNHGRSATSKHDHPHLGTNSRLDGLQAALLNVKLPYLDAWNQDRRDAAARYREGLSGYPVRFVDQTQGSEPVHHLEVVRVPARDTVRERLAEEGIGTGIHYPVPVHQLTPYQGTAPEPLPVAERAKDEILSLPMFPGLSGAEIDRVIDAVAGLTSEVAA